MFKSAKSGSDDFFRQGDFSEEMRETRSFEKKLRWLIKNPPQEAYKVLLTPAMAEIILQQNTSNRPLTNSTVESYARQMQNGLWKWTGEPIIIATDGRLLDGQHRLHACIRANAPITISLSFGISPDAFDKIDIGKKRTSSDIFAIHGEANYSMLAAAGKLVWRYENTGFLPRPELEPQSAELWRYVDENHDALRAHVSKHSSLFNSTGWGTPSTFVALYYLSGLVAPRAADEFYYQLATGNDLPSRAKDYPVIRLRTVLNADIKEHAMGRGMSPLLKAAYTAKAWNAYRTKGKITQLRWRGDQAPDEAFPELK